MASPLDIYGLKSSTTIHAEKLAAERLGMSHLEADFSALGLPRTSVRAPRKGKLDRDDSNLSEPSTHGKVHCVCFDLEPELHYIELRDELPHDLIEAVWYDDDELKQMITSATAVLAGTNTEDSPRGLENYSFEGAQRRRLERSKASEAVLGEQLRQQAAKACENTFFPNADELIRAEYMKVSKKQQDIAYERARNDEADALGRSSFSKSLSAVKNWFSSDRQLVQPL